jgi:hypothetical protein
MALLPHQSKIECFVLDANTINTRRMMTPKDMAQSLVNEFDGVGLQMRNEAIACALICVNRILGVIDYETHLKTWLYYKEVKQEIELL